MATKWKFDVEFKVNAIALAETTNNHSAARQLNVDRKQIRSWRKQKDQIKSLAECGNLNRLKLSAQGRSQAGDASETSTIEGEDKDKSSSSHQDQSVGISENMEDVKEPGTEMVIKLSPSDLEMSSSSEDESDDFVKDKSTDFNNSSNESSDYYDESELDVKVFGEGEGTDEIKDENNSQDRNDHELEVPSRLLRTRTVKKRKSSESSDQPKKRGRRKDPRRLDGRDDDSSSTDDDDKEMPNRYDGGGGKYHPDFKEKVLKYATTHSNSATAEKFDLTPKLVRTWRKQMDRIETQGETPLQKRSKGKTYTIEEKLEAVAFAAEKSAEEASLLYNVDSSTIMKWRRKKDELQAMLLDESLRPKKRGRKKDPRRLDGKEDTTTDDEADEEVPVRAGTGYHVLFKRKVLKYATTHSNSATAEKFGLKMKLIREWKKMKEKIEQDCETPPARRPRGEGYTVQEKLQAVAFAAERSIDEARLLYNVDSSTIIKWRRHKDKLEARLQNGQGDAIRAPGCGNKPKFGHIEESLRDWIVGLRLKQITVNPKMILEKAVKLIEANNNDGQPMKVPKSFTWVERFLKRHQLISLLGTTLGHEDPSEIITFQLLHGSGDVTDLANNINEIPINRNKRHRRRITLEDKLNIIQRLEAGRESQMGVARSLNVATSTIQTIWSCRQKILEKAKNSKVKKPASITDSMLWRKYTVLAAALQDWYEQLTGNGSLINAQSLKDKAVQLSATYKLTDFGNDATRWLKQFCKRQNLNEILAELRGISPESKIQQPSLNTSLHTEKFSNNDAGSSSLYDSQYADNNEFSDDFTDSLNSTPQTNTSHVASAINQPVSHFLFQPTSMNPVFLRRDIHQNAQSSTNSAGPSAPSQNTTSPVSIDEALCCIERLRTWISANYGHNEVALNNHLASIENGVLKKREV